MVAAAVFAQTLHFEMEPGKRLHSHVDVELKRVALGRVISSVSRRDNARAARYRRRRGPGSGSNQRARCSGAKGAQPDDSCRTHVLFYRRAGSS